tara:strand:- start:125 stop:553 length:429 start_codon:yes stop_codon:yes gene_type:complete
LSTLGPFHLAIAVRDLLSTRDFYLNVLGAKEGRSASTWVDFNLFGHQVVAHAVADNSKESNGSHNEVDADMVPVPHFGVILELDEWNQLAEQIQKAGWPFDIEPKLRFEGTSVEQSIMFLTDPSGNAIEFKSFKDPANLFTK